MRQGSASLFQLSSFYSLATFVSPSLIYVRGLECPPTGGGGLLVVIVLLPVSGSLIDESLLTDIVR